MSLFDFSRGYRPRPTAPPPIVAPQRGSVVLGRTAAGQPLSIPRQNQQTPNHLLLLGMTGSGKTTVATEAICQAIAYEYSTVAPRARRAFSIIDGKQDLCAAILSRLASICPESLDNTYFLSPFARHGQPGTFPFNLIHADKYGVPNDVSARITMNLIGKASMSGGVLQVPLGGRQMQAGTTVIHGLFDCTDDRVSLLWALDALTMPDGIQRLAGMARTERVRRALLSLEMSADVRASLADRFRSTICAYGDLERFFGAPGACISWEGLTAPGVTTLVDLSGSPAPELVDLMAQFLVRQAGEYLLSRPSGADLHPVTLCGDEAQLWIGGVPDVARRLLELGRSLSVALWVFSQGTRTLRDASGPLTEALFVNCPRVIAGKIGRQDAQLLLAEAGFDHGPVGQQLLTDLIRQPPRDFVMLERGVATRFTATPIPETPAAVIAAHAVQIHRTGSRLAHLVGDDPPRLWDVAGAPPAVAPPPRAPRPRMPRSRFG